MLCKKYPADKSGSHIIPHFLVKAIFDAEDRKSRDKDVAYKIGNRDYEVAIGRSVLPEKIEKVLGEFEPEDIKKLKPEYIQDHIFCTDCEAFFADLESFYSKLQTRPASDGEQFKSTDNHFKASMFWLSIFWRVSATNLMHMSMGTKWEDKARRDLINYQEFLMDGTDKALSFSWCYKVMAIPSTKKDEDSIGTIFFHPIHKMPYMAIISEYVVALYSKPNHLDNPEQLFYGLEIPLRDAFVNNTKEGEVILPISKKVLDEAVKKLNKKIAVLRLRRESQILDLLHQKLGGKGQYMPRHIKDHILHVYTRSELPPGRKYTLEGLIVAVNNVIPNYMQN